LPLEIFGGHNFIAVFLLSAFPAHPGYPVVVIASGQNRCGVFSVVARISAKLI